MCDLIVGEWEASINWLIRKPFGVRPHFPQIGVV